MIDDMRGRIAAINTFLEASTNSWPFLCAELDRIERELIETLITNDSEEVRGRIKALRAIKELPETLQAERSGLTEGLSE